MLLSISPGDHRFAQLPLANHPANHRCGMAATNALIPFLPGYRPLQRRRVLVHDAARPCLHQDDLARLLTISAKQPGRRYPRQSGARHHETRRTVEKRWLIP
ncbi:2-C-methyl-D-erythritol 4-phosphate cytidylyltransferase [Salmonella enterica subsp. enterica serovar Weltevreden]|nr:2-C-methyl-D-erythritol 4-phosphate cytidylyltransferase [Salmonella enterica subsp. enterica serovar Weltevreden]